jgi:hypothetical protein
MKELYVEGLASHDGPESCAGVREDAGEALTGVRALSGSAASQAPVNRNTRKTSRFFSRELYNREA